MEESGWKYAWKLGHDIWKTPVRVFWKTNAKIETCTEGMIPKSLCFHFFIVYKTIKYSNGIYSQTWW